ncbi:hypothetical protein F443_16657 [Phytophthora nicotianae P1569]|uniref:Uncharacterized protein n=1 Tax=Phytophthora nicotianae P1569 TaxID=1317065 RepID=V9EH00_PHYNI|nr:hypothetical protein F443_16657 [Phytophthora nicotianae P1569]
MEIGTGGTTTPAKQSRIVPTAFTYISRSIRDGQDSGQYMVVDIDLMDHWPEVVCSPLGAVKKNDTNPNEEVLFATYVFGRTKFFDSLLA